MTEDIIRDAEDVDAPIASIHWNPFRYTGRKLDPETGLYYYRARYYDPGHGRFLETDPVFYEDQMNLYAYVGNDPINMTDPTGLFQAGPHFVSRSTWSQIPPNPSQMTRSLVTYKRITLHHTGRHRTPHAVEQLHRGRRNGPLRTLGSIAGLAQTYQGYGDVGYNYLIDSNGYVYEARSLDYTPAHVKGQNSGNIGIAFLGDFSDGQLSDNALTALEVLIEDLNADSEGGYDVYFHGDFDDHKKNELKGAEEQIYETVGGCLHTLIKSAC